MDLALSPRAERCEARAGTRSLPMPMFICETCGAQYAERASVPPACAICEDERQYVQWTGQRWTTHGELAREHRVRLETDADLLGIGITPAFGIPQRALHVPTDAGNILWECTSLVTPEAVEVLKARGGVDLIVISHPHFYASMVEWSDALGGVPILLNEADRQWVNRSSPRLSFWRGDEHALSPSVTLLRCPGHFEGSTVLHWKHGAKGRGVLLSGDALHVVQDRRHVTFMYSVPNYIPLHPDRVIDIRRRVEGLAFDDVYGYTWGLNIIGGARAAVDASFERYLRAVGRV
jgi:glyoxylase-like metal-dependent hydrolase (beta-lactamase superfamily II)